jgi:hypothetical protein
MPDGRLVNDARNDFLVTHDRADRVQPWEQRSAAQRALDEHIAGTVAAAVRAQSRQPGEAPGPLEAVRRRAEVWAALPDGEGARFAREILGVLDDAGADRG